MSPLLAIPFLWSCAFFDQFRCSTDTGTDTEKKARPRAGLRNKNTISFFRASVLVALTLTCTSITATARAEEPEIMCLSPMGHEVFSDTILDSHSSYIAMVTGTTRYASQGQEIQTDAEYATDEDSNFTLKYRNVAFDPEPEILSSDRAAHEYVFRFVGNGKRLSAKFVGWKKRSLPVSRFTNLSGLLCVELARDTTPPALSWTHSIVAVVLGPLGLFGGGLLIALVLIVMGDRIDERRRTDAVYQEQWRQTQREKERRAHEVAARRAEGHRQYWEAELRKRFDRICVDYQIRDFLGNREFQENHARKNKAALLRERDRIIGAYRTLHADRELVALLRRERPEIYARVIWEMQALSFAEQIDVERPIPPPPPPPPPVAVPKRKPTQQEFRAGMVRREQSRSQDKIAKARARLEGVLEARKMLDKYPLDPDERLRHEAEIVGDIINDDDANGSSVL